MTILNSIFSVVDRISKSLSSAVPEVVSSGGFSTSATEKISNVNQGTQILSTVTGIDPPNLLNSFRTIGGYVNNVLSFIKNVKEVFSTEKTNTIVDTQLITGEVDETKALNSVVKYIDDPSGVELVTRAQQGLDSLQLVYGSQVEKIVKNSEEISYQPETPGIEDTIGDEISNAKEIVDSLITTTPVVVCDNVQNAQLVNWDQCKTTILRSYQCYQLVDDEGSSTPAAVSNLNLLPLSCTPVHGWNEEYTNDGSHITFRVSSKYFKDNIKDKDAYEKYLCADITFSITNSGDTIDTVFGADNIKLFVGSGNSDSSKILTESWDLDIIGGSLIAYLQIRAPYDDVESWFDFYVQTTTDGAVVGVTMTINVNSVSMLLQPTYCNCGCEDVEYYVNGEVNYVNEDTMWPSLYGKLTRYDLIYTDPNFSVPSLFNNRIKNTIDLDIVCGALKLYSNENLPLDGIDEKYKQFDINITDLSSVGDWLYVGGPLEGLTPIQKQKVFSMLRNDIHNTYNGRFFNQRLNEILNDVVS